MKNKTSNRGFTLVEIVVVMVIIALIMTVVGPRIFGQLDTAKVRTAETQIKTLKGTLAALRLDIGRFPTAAEGLAMLNTRPTDEKIKARWRGPYLDGDVPVDPWDTPYQYSLPGDKGQPYALYSLGADKKRGGEAVDADIGDLPPS